MHSTVLFASVLSLAACSPAALTESEHHGLTELSHEVSVRPDGTSAQLRVSRVFRNDTPAFQSYARLLGLPPGAVATALRVGNDGQWQPSPRLASAEETTFRWDSLTALGDATPTTLGLLQWSFADEAVELKLFGVAPGATVSVEYSVELPRDFAAGALRFDYPVGGALPVFHLAQAPGMTVELLRLSDDEDTFRLDQPRNPEAPTDARWATYPLGVDRQLLRLELDVAEQLSVAPVRPNVVFLVDASHSQGPEGIANQLSLVAPFLANAPDAQVEVVIYRRHAERLFGRFVAAPDVPALLGSVPAHRLGPANGSNVDEAAALTAALLSHASGPGRVILLTDGRLRYGLTSELVNASLSALAPDVVVHVVSRSRFENGALQLLRYDDADLAPVAAAHGGMSAVADGLVEGSPEADKAMLGLLRPVSLDDVTVEGVGVDDARFEVESTLPEGSSTRLMAVHARAPMALLLKGRLWAREHQQVIDFDPRLAGRLPALALGDAELREQLRDDEVRAAAFASNAVSSLTSFLSAPNAATTSIAGLVDDGRRCIGLRNAFIFPKSSRSACSLRTVRREPLAPQLKALLADGVAICRAAHGQLPLGLMIQATRDEVVAVSATSASAEFAACVTEVAWAVRLGPAFNLESITWDLEL